jgi:hypothetical protein
MRGFTNIKELNLKILSELDDRSLFNVCLTNKYLKNLCKDENFWFQRSVNRFPLYLVEKKEDETWRHFYLFQLQKETMFLGDLVLSEVNEIPWYPTYSHGLPPISQSYYFQDQFDNLLIYNKEFNATSYVYISSMIRMEDGRYERIKISHTIPNNDFPQYNPANGYRIRIDLLYDNRRPDVYTEFGNYEGVVKHYEDTKNKFFTNKNKQFYLNDNQQTINDFDSLVIEKIEPFLPIIEQIKREKEDELLRKNTRGKKKHKR